MHTIKKYANRKLYHTNRKQYITLEGIAELVQAGEQVQIIDNETGEDITAAILSQVMLQARGRRSSLPTHLLTDLIQAGGDTISGLRRSVFSAIGGPSTTDIEIKRRIDQLVADKTIGPEESARMQRLLLPQHPEAAHLPLDLPSATDVALLKKQVEALTDVVEQLLADRDKT